MRKIKLAIIGAGNIARHHLRALQAVDWLEAAGITSRTYAKASQLAKEFKITKCTNEIDSLIKESRPDGLMVLVSEDQMCPVVSSLFRYGLPIFLEKPAGLSVEENLKLLELSRSHNVSTMVGFNRRFYSIFHKGLEVIRKNGPLHGVMVEGHERMWRIREGQKKSEHIMNQWLFVNGVHTIDLLRFFGGEPTQVNAIVHQIKEPHGDQFAAVMELESGAIGQYTAHWYSPGGWRAVLYGDGVTVEFKPLEQGLWLDKDLKTHPIEPDPVDVQYKTGFVRQLEALGRLVRDGTFEWPMQDLERSYKTMLLAEKMALSLASKTADLS